MSNSDAQLLRVAVLVVAAIVLGVAALQVLPSRVATLAAAAPAPVPMAAPAPAPAPAPVPASAPLSAPEPASPTDGGATGDDEDEGVVVADPAPLRRGGIACATGHRTARVMAATSIHAAPGGRRIGALPAFSKYLSSPGHAWVQETTADSRWGRISVPWGKPVARSGWVRLDRLSQTRTRTMVVADLSERSVTVYDRCRPVLRVRSAIGRAGSPSPTGRFWISDRVPVPASQRASFGSFAFGLSTVQPNLPRGWTGGDQMAIHGTGAPGSIGEAASAGCLRVSEDALRKLRPLLQLGTPVVIQR